MWAPEKRQRVAQACDECKRRKKQCSGNHPCTACTAKSSLCTFSHNPPPSNHTRNTHEDPSRFHRPPKRKAKPSPTWQIANTHTVQTPQAPAAERPPGDSAPEDETPIQNPGRLLQDRGGRFLYIGDSAALSFLQSIRRQVEKKLGPSPFTVDSSRSRILEATISTPDSVQPNYAIPDRESARFMVDSFFANTAGLLCIFSKVSFEKKMSDTYERPLDADPGWLCQLNLVFAIGLQMHKDVPVRDIASTRILEMLEANGVKRAERFYLAARRLKDPTIEFEDGGMEVAQSLLLMAIYMLASSKRNTAWAYLGMSVNLSYALGIHKEETLPMFDVSEQAARKNLWHSLYITDCFLSTSLGRPNTITCETASELASMSDQRLDRAMSQDSSLLFSVNASKITGEILSRVYHKRKASRSIAYLLSLRFNEWMRELPPDLHWRSSQFQAQDPDLVLKRLHINLIYFDGIILLTRPFLLYQINRKLSEPASEISSRNTEQPSFVPRTDSGHPEQAFCFHGACVHAAIHSIIAVNAAFSANALPRRDPFVIYWLFSAALVVFANTFCPVYEEVESGPVICMALTIIRFCGDTDPLARRYQTILESFMDALQEDRRTKEQVTNSSNLGHTIFDMLFGSEGTGFNSDASLTQSRMLAPSTTPLGRADGGLPQVSTGLDALYFDSAAQGQSDDSIDGSGIWWSPGQDIFGTSGDVRVPLYGLMEPT